MRSLRPVADLECGTLWRAWQSRAPSRAPSRHFSRLLLHPLYSLPPAPPSRGHFLMPFLNLAPIPPKSNQIHNLIRQKNEENVRLPASPLTGCRAAANLEIGKCYNGGATDGWEGWVCRRDPAGGPPGLHLPNPALHPPRAVECAERQGWGQLHLLSGLVHGGEPEAPP